MANLAVCLSILAMASWAVSGADIDDVDTHVEVSGTLGSDTQGEVVAGHKAVYYGGLTDIGRSGPDGSELSVLQVNETIKPEVGEKIPPFVQSFPGCSCEYMEGSKPKWKCAGTIAYPPEVSGDKCCCCGIPCQRSNRCNNKQCLAIGIDQGPEVAAEQAAWDKLMKGADVLLGDDLPGFIADLGPGMCNHARLIQACKKKGATPVCDHPSYKNIQGGKACYTPNNGLGPHSKNIFYARHFSYWGTRQFFGIENDSIFYGMCFMGASGTNALAPAGGDSHAWVTGNARLSPNARVLATGQVNNVYFRDIDKCKPKDQGGVGCWRTICVKREPNR